MSERNIAQMLAQGREREQDEARAELDDTKLALTETRRELDAVTREKVEALKVIADYGIVLANVTRERDEANRRVMDFTGAPTVEEAFAVIVSPVEWDAIASYHGVSVVGGTPTDEMVDRAARVLWDESQGHSIGFGAATSVARSCYLTLARRVLAAAIGGDT